MLEVIILLIGFMLIGAGAAFYLYQQEQQRRKTADEGGEKLLLGRIESETPKASTSNNNQQLFEEKIVEEVGSSTTTRRRSTIGGNETKSTTNINDKPPSRRPSDIATITGSRRQSLATTSPQTTEGKRITPSTTTSSSQPPSPKLGMSDSPKSKSIKSVVGRSVTFEPPPIPSPPANGGPPHLVPIETLQNHADSVETAAFSEEGYLATGGGPEDGFVRLYNRGVGKVGTIRAIMNVRKDCGKHDTASVLNFAVDEGKKSTLLLVGTRTERFLMGYKISKTAANPPILVFHFSTHHGSALDGAVGFVPSDAANYFDPQVFFCTSAKGTREVKIWNGKGSCLHTLDCECWTMGLRISPHGKHLGVLSSGGGPGVIYSIKREKSVHKFSRSKLFIPIADSIGGLHHTSARRVIEQEITVQASQDILFDITSEQIATSLFCREDLTVAIGHTDNIDAHNNWDLEVLLKPEILVDSSAALVRVALLIPKIEGKLTRAIISKGKNVFFFDASLALIGILEGRREDGDVIGVALSPSFDFVVIVSFGASVARVLPIN